MRRNLNKEIDSHNTIIANMNNVILKKDHDYNSLSEEITRLRRGISVLFFFKVIILRLKQETQSVIRIEQDNQSTEFRNLQDDYFEVKKELTDMKLLFTKEMDLYNSMLTNKDSEIEMLTIHNSNKDQKLSEIEIFRQQIFDLKNLYAKKDEEHSNAIFDLNSLLTKNNKEIEMYNTIISNLKSNLNDADRKYQQLSEEFDTFKSKNGGKADQLYDLSIKYDKLNSEFKELKKNNDEFIGIEQEFEKAINELSDVKFRYEKDCSNFNLTISDLKSTIAVQNKDITDLNDQFNRLKAELVEINDVNLGKLSSLNLAIDNKSKQNEQLLRELVNVKNELINKDDQYNGSLGLVNKSVFENQEEIQKLTTTIDNLRADVKIKNESHCRLEDELASIKLAVAARGDEVAKLTRRINELNEIISQKDLTCGDLVRQVKELTNELDGYKRRIGKSNNEMLTYAQEIQEVNY